MTTPSPEPAAFSSTNPKTKPKPCLVMKPIIPFALLGAFFAVGAAKAASTTPVGYVTETLQPNRFNLVGVSLHNTVVAAGVLDSSTGSSVTDAAVNFSTTLAAGQKYILEITNGSGQGTVQLISSWTIDTLTTPEDISGSVVNNVTTYALRKVSTVSDIFGATNSAGLTASPDGDFSIVDRILILNDGGGFDTVYYFNDGAGTEGWFDADGLDASNKPIIYSDGFYVQRVAGAPLPLVVSGEVKTTETDGVLSSGFNYMSSVAPVSLTLGTSGLENFLSSSPDGDFSLVDNVLIPLPSGAFKTCYYFDDGAGTVGWFDADGLDASGEAMTSGFLIQNRGVAKPFSIDVPASYSSL